MNHKKLEELEYLENNEQWYQISSRKMMKRFLILYFVVALFIATGMYSLYRMEYRLYLENESNIELYGIQLEEIMVEKTVAETVDYLKGLSEVFSNTEDKEEARRNMKMFMNGAENYKNVFITEKESFISVMEVEPEINKSQIEKKFFEQRSTMLPKEILVCPDSGNKLNEEKNNEEQYRWLFGSYFDTEGSEKQWIVVELELSDLIKKIQERKAKSVANQYILKYDGQTINAGQVKDSIQEFANEEGAFVDAYKAEWNKIHEGSSGQFSTQNGLFTFRTMYIQQLVNKHAGQSVSTNSPESNWILVTHIPNSILNKNMEMKKIQYVVISFLLLVMGYAVVMVFISNSESRYHYQEQLVQNHQALVSVMEELRESQEELIEKEKLASLNVIIGGISHEMSTPVGNGMTGLSYIIEDISGIEESMNRNELTDQNLKEHIQNLQTISRYVLENIKKTGVLLQKFKEITQLEGDTETTNFDFVSHVITIIEAELKYQALENVKVHYEGPKSLIVKSSSKILWNIVKNIISNSLLHGFEGKGGNIQVFIKESQDRIKLVIEDDGKGMEASVKSRMMDPFFTTKMSQGNTGIGLNIVYNLVTRNLQGTMHVDSHLGKGTRVVIEFPVKYPEI